MKNYIDYSNIFFAGGAFLFSLIEFIKGINLIRSQRSKKRSINNLINKLSRLKELNLFTTEYKSRESFLDKNKAQKDSFNIDKETILQIDAYYKNINTSIPRLEKYALALSNMHNQRLIDKLDIFKIANNAYSTFLKYEENFSMSYGYGRYIDALRPLVCLEKEYTQALNANNIIKEEIVFKKINIEIQKLIPYIDEMQLKFTN